MVLAVRDIDQTVLIGSHVVDSIELARTRPRLPPRKQMVAVWIVLVNAGVAIAV